MSQIALKIWPCSVEHSSRSVGKIWLSTRLTRWQRKKLEDPKLWIVPRFFTMSGRAASISCRFKF